MIWALEALLQFINEHYYDFRLRKILGNLLIDGLASITPNTYFELKQFKHLPRQVLNNFCLEMSAREFFVPIWQNAEK